MWPVATHIDILITTDVYKSCNNILIFLNKQLKILVKANLDLVKWAQGNQTPSFEEYVEAGGTALTTYATLMYSFVGMGETVGKDAYEWVRSRPRLIKSLAAKGRLMDDITDYEVRKKQYIYIMFIFFFFSLL